MRLQERFRPKDLRDILDETFDLYKENFLLLFKAAAFVLLPLQLFLALIGIPSLIEQLMVTEVEDSNIPASLGPILGLIAYYVVTGALTMVISERYLGRNISIGEAYREVFRRSGTLFKTLLLASLASGGIFIVVISVFAGSIRLTTPLESAASEFFMLFLGWIVMAVVIGMMFMTLFLIPVVMLEGISGMAAVKRSWQLFFYSPAKPFIRLLLILILYLIIYGIMLLPAGLLLGTVSDTQGGDPNRLMLFLLSGYEGLVNAALQPLHILVVLLLYYDIRVRREGFDMEMMANELPGESLSGTHPVSNSPASPDELLSEKNPPTNTG